MGASRSIVTSSRQSITSSSCSRSFSRSLSGLTAAEVGVDALERAVVDEQARRRLVADTGDARDVVGAVALERLEVDHLAGLEAVALVDALRVVDDGRLDAEARRHQLRPLGDELEHVEVARDDDRLDVSRISACRVSEPMRSSAS